MRLHPSFFLAAFLCIVHSNSYAQDLAPGTKVYTCITADGRKLTADQPIRECANREQRIIGSSGALVAIIPPQLTAKQERILLGEKARQQEILKKEQEQRDIEQQYIRALLERYPTPQAYALAHQSATRPVLEKIEEVKAKRAHLLKQQYDLKIERDTYADGKQTPDDLAKNSQAVDTDLIVQDRVLDRLNDQLKKIDAAFDAEKQILLPYWKQTRTAQ